MKMAPTIREIRVARAAPAAHIKAKDKQSVTADVDTVHHDGNDHRDAGVAHCAEQRCSGIVQGDEWVG